MRKRNLPHLYPANAAFFITFRLQNSIPIEALSQLKAEKEFKIKQIQQWESSEADKRNAVYIEEKVFFAKYDKALEKFASDGDFLKKPEIAGILADKIRQYDGKLYTLIAYCIMPNHAHFLFTTDGHENADIPNIMKLIKGGSAYLCNQALNRKGRFWQQESYDHYIRNSQEFENIKRYIVENPVKAGLAKEWKEWPFTYLAE